MRTNYARNCRVICTHAIASGQITRHNFNIVRRCGALLEQREAKLWHTLNGEIWHKRVTIVEDGDIISEVALSFDAQMTRRLLI
jgi:hypothetical protein